MDASGIDILRAPCVYRDNSPIRIHHIGKVAFPFILPIMSCDGNIIGLPVFQVCQRVGSPFPDIYVSGSIPIALPVIEDIAAHSAGSLSVSSQTKVMSAA